MAAPLAAGSIFSRRNSTVRPTRCVPSRTMSSSPISALSSRAWSNSSASMCRIWNEPMTTAGGGHQTADAIARRGLMLVLSSPSGAGKTTLSRKLLAADPGGELSVSVTTRKQRPGEVDGRDYHFLDAPRFDAMVENGGLLEWAQVFGNRYGTPRLPVEATLVQGRDVLFDIDWQGTQQLRGKGDRDLVSIFVLPPSVPDLELRLRAGAEGAAWVHLRRGLRLRTRAQDSDEVIHARMGKAADEMSHWAEYDYVVINTDIDRAFAQVQSILAAERLKRERQTGLSEFVRRLQAEL